MIDFATPGRLLPQTIKCSYRSKPCNSVRATKLNGDFHKLCEYHRRRANLNQQRVHQRRKLRQLDEQQSQYRGSLDEEHLSDIELEFECEPSPSPCGDLPLSDLELLELFLSDNYTDGDNDAPKSQREYQSMDYNCTDRMGV